MASTKPVDEKPRRGKVAAVFAGTIPTLAESFQISGAEAINIVSIDQTLSVKSKRGVKKPPASTTNTIDLNEKPPASTTNTIDLNEKTPASTTNTSALNEKPPASTTNISALLENAPNDVIIPVPNIPRKYSSC